MDSESKVNSRRKLWIESEFAKMIVNSKSINVKDCEWIREIDCECEEDLRERWWIESEFAKKIVNWKFIHEGYSELKVYSRKDGEFEVDSRKK